MYLKKIEVKVCPYCGGKDFGEGRQRGHAKLVKTSFALSGEDIHHIICMTCGSIVRSYVKHPDRFK